MKVFAAAAFVGLAAVGFLPSAQAQGVPQGSYLRSCSEVSTRGDSLLAVCRTREGRERRTTLANVNRCVGDIVNNDGYLGCTYGNGPAQGRPMVSPPVAGPEPRNAQPRYEEPRREEPRYGQPRYEEPRREEPRYGERRERCENLRREAQELRVRIEREWNPLDRARLESRLRELRAEEERCLR